MRINNYTPLALVSVICLCVVQNVMSFGIAGHNLPSARTTTMTTTASSSSCAFGVLGPNGSSRQFALHMAGDDDVDGSAQRRNRRRVRRKDDSKSKVPAAEEITTAADEIEEEEEYEYEDEDDFIEEMPPAPAAVLPRAEFDVVEVAIRDVRNVGGDAISGATASSRSMANEDEATDDDDLYSSYQQKAVATRPNLPPLGFSGSSSSSSDDNNNSLDSLLADAKRLRAEKGGDGLDQDGFDIGGTLKNVISTIVTVDFFFVFGLLLWFLAGIFCSYILKDDGVQIAFNNIFESIVQPALGLLMVAAVAGGVTGSDDKKEDAFLSDD